MRNARPSTTPQELDAKVRRLRDEVKETKKTFDKTEDDLKALQSMGQIIGEVLRQLDDEKCAIAPAVQTPRSSARPSPFFSPFRPLASDSRPLLLAFVVFILGRIFFRYA